MCIYIYIYTHTYSQIHNCNPAKMAHLNAIFTKAIHLKCLNFKNKAISSPIPPAMN